MANRKYKFVEEFIDPETGLPYMADRSPRRIETRLHGTWLLHQIAKIEYKKVIRKQKTTQVDAEGHTIEGPEETIETYREEMGDIGGWIYDKQNLSQGGTCWVKGGGYVVGNAYVSEDAVISSEAGGNARVYGSARVSGDAVVSGHCQVYGNARVDGDLRMAVGGYANVEGTVTDGATVDGHAKVGEEGLVGGGSAVFGSAQIYGEVKGESGCLVHGRAIVYGRVGGAAKVFGDAVVEATGSVIDKSSVNGASIVEGLVSGESAVFESAHIGEDGSVASGFASGNADVDGEIGRDSLATGNARLTKQAVIANESSVIDNGTIGERGVLDTSSVRGNGICSGPMKESSIEENGKLEDEGAIGSHIKGNAKAMMVIDGSIEGGSVALGPVRYSTITGGGLVEDTGAVTRSSVGDGAVVAGSVNSGSIEGSSVVAEGGGVYGGAMSGNSRTAEVLNDGSLGDNAVAGVAFSSSATGNGVAMDEKQSVQNNEVGIEKAEGDGSNLPEGAAVLCKVETE